MKTLYPTWISVLWVALAFTATHEINASDFHPDSFEMKVLGVSFKTQTNEKKLVDAPKWEPFSNKEFPISVKEVFFQAKEQLEKEIKKEIPSIISLYPVRIEHRMSGVSGAWFSLVVFSYGLESGPTSGVKMPYVVAVVYADGSVAPIQRSHESTESRE